MSLFGKKRSSGGTIDFTYLQKRGLLPPPKHRYSVKLPTSSDGTVDLGALASAGSGSTSQSSDSSGAFGFLSNLAGSSATPQPAQPALSETGSDPVRATRQARLAEFNAMKVKIEDLEYRLERSLERIAQLEAQLAEMRK